MNYTNRRERSVARSWSTWLFAIALAMALGPVIGNASDPSTSLEPEQIRVVQRALNDKGHHVEITGAWDERTRDALADLQAASGLPATGTMNRATARLLGVDPYAVVPVGGRDANPDPTVNCNLNNTVDCRPGA